LLSASQLLKVVPNSLVEALAHGGGGSSRLLGNAFVNGQRDIHHDLLCAHIMC
jgi:hypothetical protein